MRVRPYHSARSTAVHVYHEDDDCPAGRAVPWFDKVEGRRDCEPCPQCVGAVTSCLDRSAAAEVS
ncbi:hypothetical protein [Cellulomonas dongxiuzhuiae]|uniref:PRL2-8 n=1 Tax=Cellulomonas dongxiuzhuiae TaxID=2819979 RepID=A0ABX8GKC6_9CELL|nr:hypothetical protein [Cellulomonas dongxiuzhuiae]MBO3095681.1 hypothetical protein [Cellulomonas dongxiuzhuiae]QWC16634.1 hypothetical protein KKR89_02965 [Cellulomonas dongxiuzhuiae]